VALRASEGLPVAGVLGDPDILEVVAVVIFVESPPHRETAVLML
jgi:hypothetical protein